MREKATQEQLIEYRKKNGEFKLNLPDTVDKFLSGNGEGIWATVEKSEHYHDDDKDDCIGKHFYAYALNDSIYYPDIEYGSKVLAEHRGESFRAVAVWDDLNHEDDCNA